MRVFRKVMVAALAVATLGGCSSDGADAKSYDEATAEYNATVKELGLPENATPYPGLQKTSGESQLTYEDGAATGMAQTHWLCQWEKEWLRVRSTDPAGAEAALAQIAKYPSMEDFQQTDATGQKFFNDDLAAAKLGDPSGIQQSVKANCS